MQYPLVMTSSQWWNLVHGNEEEESLEVGILTF